MDHTVFLRLPEVLHRCGLGRSTVYKLLSEGRFPVPIKITGGRAVGWVETELEAWLQASIAASGQPAPIRTGVRTRARLPRKWAPFP